MEKEDILEHIKNLAARENISEEEIISAYKKGLTITPQKSTSVLEVLSYIGGAIVCLGIGVFLWQNWGILTITTKLLATLGSGAAAFIIGVIFGRDFRLEGIASAFFFIAAIVSPIGLFVVFNSAGFDVSGFGGQSLVSGIMFVTFFLSHLASKKSVLTFFAAVFGSWLFLSVTSLYVEERQFVDDLKFFLYRAGALGVFYFLLGALYRKKRNLYLAKVFSGLGIIVLLGAVFALGGWIPNQNIVWELLFPVFIIAALVLSIKLQSTTFLVFTSLYLMAYIIKMTAEYFTEGLSWPFILVLIGLSFILIGYTSIYLSRKYITER